MTELHIGIIIFAIASVVAIVIFSQWQDAKQRRRAEEILRRHPIDLLLDGDHDSLPVHSRPFAVTRPETEKSRDEPALAEKTAQQEQTSPDSQLKIETSVDNEETVTETRTPVPPPPLPETLMNVRVDYPVKLELPGRITAGRLVSARQATLSRVKKPVRWFGFDERKKAWVAIDESSRIKARHFLVGLQLVNRDGPASETDLTVFRAAIEKLAAKLTTEIDFLPIRQALADAVELDQFCVGVDVQIGVNLIPHGPVIALSRIRELAAKAGLVEQDDSHYIFKDSKGVTLFSLVSIDNKPFKDAISVPGLTLLIDIPQTPDGEYAFDCLLELARQFAKALDTLIVDDNRHPLTDESLQVIRSQITGYQAALEQAKIPAGGPLAARLFS